MVERARTHGLKFYQHPRRRFPGTRLEHQTFFLEDPSHNLLEFNTYTHDTAIFGEHDTSIIGDETERGNKAGREGEGAKYFAPSLCLDV